MRLICVCFVVWGWMILCAWHFAVQSVRVCVRVYRTFFLFEILLSPFSGVLNTLQMSVDENELLFRLGYLMRSTPCNLTAIVCAMTALLDCLNTQIKEASISRYRVRNCNQFLPLFCYHGNWFLLALIFISSLLLSSLLLRILSFYFILLQHMNILYYVLYWLDGWLFGRFCLCFVWMCIVTNFNVFVLLCVQCAYIFWTECISERWQKEWKKMISNKYLFNRLQPCTRIHCTEQT